MKGTVKSTSATHAPIRPDANLLCSKTFLARLCEQAERYDEMVTYMKEVAKVRDALDTAILMMVAVEDHN